MASPEAYGLNGSLMTALDDLEIGVSLVDEDGIIVFANDRYAAFFGYRQEELLGKHFTCLLDDSERDSALQFHRETLHRRGEKTRQRSFRRIDGSRVELSAVSQPLTERNGTVLRLTVVKDRTAYIEAVERFEHIASIPLRNPNPIIELDRSGKTLFVNESCMKLFPGIETRGTAHPYLEGIDPENSRGTLPPREIRIGDRWFQQIVHALDEFPDRIRVYGFETTARKQAEMRLAESEAHLRAILDNSKQAFILVDTDGKIRAANRRAEELSDLLFHTPIRRGDPMEGLVTREYVADFAERFERAVEGSAQKTSRIFHIEGFGEKSYFDIEYTPIRDKDGRIFAVCVIASDVTEHKIHEEQSVLTTLVFDNTKEGILVTDDRVRILRVNRAFCDITGYSTDDFIGRNPRLLQSGWHGKDFYDQLWESIRREGAWRGELWDRRKDGTLYAQWSSITAIKDESDAVKYYVAIVNEITEQKEAAKRIHHLAHYDTLTELPNRTLLFDRIAHSFDMTKRAGTRIALLYVDLDRFKHVNDGFGHEEGDRFLREAALRIRSVMRASDTVARLGGDEFLILIEGLTEPGDAAQVAEKVLAKLAEPFRIGDTELIIGAGIGIAVSPEDGTDFEVLLRNADAAMTKVKRGERIGFRFYQPEMNDRALERLQFESRLRRAESDGALSVNYQPQIRLADGVLLGWETLLRWKPEGIGPVPPAVFIPIAEESDLINSLGEWVLRTALADRKSTLDSVIAVNLSAKQFTGRNLVDRVRSMLEDSGLPGSALELEITESAVMHDVESSIYILRGLKELGIGIAIDDFGTGYSSLSYLKRFPIDRLKIDRSFVMDLPGNPEDVAVVRTIIGLGKGLGMRIIAEGVETREQLVFLAENGCDEYQGYYGSKPLPLAEAARFKPPRP